jgi:hypothetical protein
MSSNLSLGLLLYERCVSLKIFQPPQVMRWFADLIYGFKKKMCSTNWRTIYTAKLTEQQHEQVLGQMPVRYDGRQYSI